VVVVTTEAVSSRKELDIPTVVDKAVDAAADVAYASKNARARFRDRFLQKVCPPWKPGRFLEDKRDRGWVGLWLHSMLIRDL